MQHAHQQRCRRAAALRAAGRQYHSGKPRGDDLERARRHARIASDVRWRSKKGSIIRAASRPRNAERPRAAHAAPASSSFRAADLRVAPPSKTYPAAQRPAKTSGPLRRFKDRLPLPGMSHLVPCTLSWRFDAPRSLVCGWIARTFGSPHSRNTKPRTFPTGPAVSLHPPSTASVSGRFHPPSSLSPPSESCGLRPASRSVRLAAGGS